MAGTDTMRAAAAEPEAGDAAAPEEAAAERSALREEDDDDRKPREAAGALEGELRALAAVEAVEEKEVGAAAAMVCGFSSS